MSRISSLLEAVETIYGLDVLEHDRQIKAHQENLTLLIQAALFPEEFNTERPGPWHQVYKRVAALEKVAEIAQNIEDPELEEAVKVLDSTYKKVEIET